MIQAKISEDIKAVCPNATLGCIQAKVKVKNSDKELLEELDKCAKELEVNLKLEGVASLPEIHDSREVYKKLGKAPSKYRVSSEALIRRILQGKGLYHINNIVEINNIISIKSHFSVGSYNVKNIESPICLNVGQEGQSYKGIGKAEVNIANLPVLSDSISTFGSPTSDSERAMITNDVEEIVMCIYSFSGDEGLENYLELAKELLIKYADADDISIQIVR
ncbi:B3/B4 domain-containing protein [Intestinibacter sp.]|uniref:B3/B4 domain-containing protein n=1 Tax=Intestinibacter sp. TaxID=1965304 RepID=UPI002A91DC40|nr:phenylalanine--tRNA ligase beta subunit-related protein [Intestinibacter sp.]MDY5213575.1 phenylalanine--tRNA ligase beta subunit-related protein [Intestinibacter sp.]